MSYTYISAELRRLVDARAFGLCEYCLIHRDDTFFGCEIDHVISEKHGGVTTADNLALACLPCNRAKGSNIATVFDDGRVVRFYHPRRDRWRDHFEFDDSWAIQGRTAIGEATARILGFNIADRLLERRILADEYRYPPVEAAELTVQSEGEL